MNNHSVAKETMLSAYLNKHLEGNNQKARASMLFNALYHLVNRLVPKSEFDPLAILNALPLTLSNHGYLDFIKAAEKLGFTFHRAQGRNVVINRDMVVMKPAYENHQWIIQLWEKDEDSYHYYNPAIDKTIHNKRRKLSNKEAFVVTYHEKAQRMEESDGLNREFFGKLLRYFKPFFIKVMGISMILNILSLSVPLFILYIYQSVVNTGNLYDILPIGLGVLIALACEYSLRLQRGKILAWVSGRVDYLVTMESLEKLYGCSPSTTRKVPISNQLARVKSFSSLREFFSGAIVSSVLEVPAALVMLLVLGLLHPYFALATIVTVVAMTITVKLFFNLAKSKIKQSATINTTKTACQLEYLDRLETIRRSGLQRYYLRRLSDLSKKSQYYELRANLLGTIIDIGGRYLSTIGIVVVIATGVSLIWSDEIPISYLIAAIFLAWRVFNPFQVLASASVRSEKITQIIRQLNRFMAIPNETSQDESKIKPKYIAGNIELKNIAIYNQAKSQFIHRNLSLTFPEGSLTTIDGESETGKSLILDLILGATSPRLGTVQIDNHNLRQYDLEYLRRHITYIGTEPLLIEGSIESNLLITNPFLSDLELENIIQHIGLHRAIAHLPKKLESIISDSDRQKIPKKTLELINFAKLYTRKSKIRLIDSAPILDTDNSLKQRFMEDLKKWKGKYTVIVVTSDRDIQALADKTIYLKQNGAPQQFTRKAS